MKILDFLSVEAIKVDLEAKNKKEVVEELVDLLVKVGKVKDKKKAVQILMEREELGSTGIGQGVAIPHGKSATVRELVAAFGRSKKGIDFESLDGDPVHLFFLLLAPENEASAHLKALAKISRLLKDKYFRRALINAESREEIIKIIKEEEEMKR